MTPTDETLRTAIALHEAGQIERAESICRDLLRIDPAHADALHLVGVTACQRGRYQDAVNAIRRSMAIGRPSALSLCNLGAAYRELGRLDDAITCFRESTQLAPTLAGAHYNLSLAWEAAGDAGAAESACRCALWTDFRLPDAHHHLGCLLANRKQYDKAIGCFQTAIDLRPRYPAAHVQLARVLRVRGRLNESADHYRCALRFSGDRPDLHHEFGTLLEALADTDGAAANYEHALRLDPNHSPSAESLSRLRQKSPTLGRVLNNLRRQITADPRNVAHQFRYARELERVARYEEAKDVCREILDIDADHRPAWGLLGRLASERGETTTAVAHYRQALRCRPDDAELHQNLADVFREGRFSADALSAKTLLPEAAAHYRRAVELAPERPVGWCRLGDVLQDADDYHAAVTCYRRALEIDPCLTAARYSLGLALRSLGRFDESLSCWNQILRADPDSATACLERGLTQIAAGRWASGWDDFECRWHNQPRPFDRPVWDGSALQTERLLVYAEQGVGDEMMFASCLPDVLTRVTECWIECDARLVPLLSRSFPAATVHGRPFAAAPPADMESPQFDLQIAMGSLPRLFRRNAADFPRSHGYLKADPNRVRIWHDRLADLGDGLKVGISWRAGRGPDVRRCIALEQWQPLFSQPSLKFVNLQYGDVDEEIASCQHRFGVTIADWNGTDLLNDLDDLAARIAALDLVVSVDNATVHLAGALGATVWALLPFAADFRWQYRTDSTPWYPTMRLFRQQQPGEWSPLLARAAGELCRR